MSARRLSCMTEGNSAELELLRGQSPKLRTATGFVLGGMLSGMAWSVLGLIAWCVVA